MKRAALWLLLAACHHTDAPPPAAPAPAAAAAPAAHDEHAELSGLPPALAKFHDLLAPRWHADKGAARTKDTCGAIADFKASASEVVATAPPPHANPEKWTAATQALFEGVTALEQECSGPVDDAKFEIAFEAVHVGFHHAMEAAAGGGEDHGEQM